MSADPFASLVAAGNRKIAAAAAPAGVLAPIEPDPAAGVSPAHAAILGALDELLTMLAGAGQLPPTARMMLSAVQSSRGMMVDGLLRMPEDQLLSVLRGLAARIAAVPGVIPGA